MGLNERRKIDELKTITFPNRVKEIEEICGKAVPYEIDWESLASDPEALNCIDNVSCHRLNMALRVICRDQLGKQAVQDGLQLVRLKNVKDQSMRRISFESGVLEMACAYDRHLDGAFADTEICSLLTSKL